jgi:hypothetical protein
MGWVNIGKPKTKRYPEIPTGKDTKRCGETVKPMVSRSDMMIYK